MGAVTTSECLDLGLLCILALCVGCCSRPPRALAGQFRKATGRYAAGAQCACGSVLLGGGCIRLHTIHIGVIYQYHVLLAWLGLCSVSHSQELRMIQVQQHSYIVKHVAITQQYVHEGYVGYVRADKQSLCTLVTKYQVPGIILHTIIVV